MLFWENIRLAFVSIRANFLRAVLTLLIIAVGITALVGILTAIDALLFTMEDNFSRMGANSFSISPAGRSFSSRHDGRQQKRGDNITLRQALEFKERLEFPATVSVFGRATGGAVVKYGDEKSSPTVSVEGIDENYLNVHGIDINEGRSFTLTELESGHNRAIIGPDIVDLLFEGKTQTALDKTISIDNDRFHVIGVFESKGASMNTRADRKIYIPLMAERKYYGYPDKNYNITVAVDNTLNIDDAISESIGVLRNIRRLSAGEENDFEMFKSSGLMDILKENTATIRIATIVIGLITLLGAAIGLMNIMLVSVTERTGEIGISKALGATRRNIMIQFLTEAVLICQMGGVLGIIFGILIGFGVAKLVGGIFIIPWAWIILGIVTCMIVGLIAGMYPAMKAAKLDPIEALRYE
jgi:putative ABC transport system permease protein